MQFRTSFPLQPQQHNRIDYDSKLVLLGSCFAENISEKLAYFKFQQVLNPFGILFHPRAIENLIVNAVNEQVYTENDVFFHNERWHCFEAHSALSNSTKEVLIQRLNTAVEETNKQITNATHIVITLGTAWAYRFIESDTFVANCHKVPQKKFLKEILSVDEIIESLEAIIAMIKSVNNKASILFTVSPVRHLKDGIIENTQSKAHLISAVHQVVEPRKNCHYFPAYEIVMDELRDYRFYKEDMIHPNQTAINYVWEAFSKVWFSENTEGTMKRIDDIQKGILHKPFNPKSKEHQDFQVNLANKISSLQQEYPYIEF